MNLLYHKGLFMRHPPIWKRTLGGRDPLLFARFSRTETARGSQSWSTVAVCAKETNPARLHDDRNKGFEARERPSLSRTCHPPAQ